MPELAEVEYFRKQWEKGLNRKVLAVDMHADKAVFRGADSRALKKFLTGAKLLGSEGHGKQMLFKFSNGGWLGVHLGMTGELSVAPAGAEVSKHDHLVLRQAKQSLVFNDPRQFGRILFHHGKEHPDWWRDRPASILSKEFTPAAMGEFLSRHGRAPIKAVLLMQRGFPGVGNWMADEILWQSKINPRARAGQLKPAQAARLHAKTRHVCLVAMETVGRDNADLPKPWLFHHRWKKGGHCPDDGSPLRRAEVGGRTTCWCPSCQKG